MDQQQPMSLFDADETGLSQGEEQQLQTLEQLIEQGLMTYLEVGNALLTIRTKRLYRKTHKNFEAYCQDRWQFGRRRANILIKAAELVDNLKMGSTDPILPTTEWQIRPLTQLEPEVQRNVWQRVVDSAPETEITQTLVKKVLEAYRYEIEAEEQDKSMPVSLILPGEYEETISVRHEYENGLPSMDSERLSVHFSSDTPEHYTPAEILDAVVACLGTIDLDPCSNSHESPNVLATQHFTAADDGLSQFWHGKVFMNPPYGREIAKWVDKLCVEYEAGRMTEAIVLVPARTDTDWWEQLVEDHKLICFVHGRLTFIGNEEVAPFPSALVYFGTECDRFYYAFRSFGRIMQELNSEMFGA